MDELVIGIDVGSQGARALVLDESGRVHGSGRSGWGATELPDGRHEQRPEQWMEAVELALSEALDPLDTPTRGRVRAMAPTSTSGTLVLTDSHGHPVRPAIMWSDTRADNEAETLAHHLEDFTRNTGLRMRGSFPLPKLVWLSAHEPAALDDAKHIMHASDYLLWHLGLERAVTDPTNALKSGYDITRNQWDSYLGTLGVLGRLPEVAPSGQVLGSISPRLADRLGLDRSVSLVGSMTDANTATLAAGVIHPGQWVTTLGTGMSVKGISRHQLVDPTGSVYSHLDPRGLWLPSGTSHLGAAAISARFGVDLTELTRLAETEEPATMLMYPLVGRGDYFPRWSPHLSGFQVGRGTKPQEFRATLEGIAVMEELAYRRFQDLGATIGDEIASMGGGVRSKLWNRIRASVQERTIHPVATPETAVGAGVMAFVGLGRAVEDVVSGMSRWGPAVEPDPKLVDAYRHLPDKFTRELETRERKHA